MPLVYNYDRNDYFFIGVDEADICQITGDPLLPGSATFVPPPSQERDSDYISVFVPSDNRWEMRPNVFWSPNISEHAPYFGNIFDGQIAIRQYDMNKLCIFTGIPRVLYPLKHAMALSGRLAYMQTRLIEIITLDSIRRQNPFVMVNAHFHEKFVTEELVLNMKRVVDEIFMNEWVRLEGDSEQFQTDHLIRVCELQDVNKLPAGLTKEHLLQMRDQDPIFFQTLTDLRNSFSHHYPVAESYDLYGRDRPTVNTLYVPKGRLNEIRLISVWLEDLVKSFNRLLVRTFGE